MHVGLKAQASAVDEVQLRTTQYVGVLLIQLLFAHGMDL
jgi:hypothetical protein